MATTARSVPGPWSRAYATTAAAITPSALLLASTVDVNNKVVSYIISSKIIKQCTISYHKNYT